MLDQRDELEFQVLRALQHRPLPLSAIASELLLPLSRIERVLAGLVDRGLIRVEPQPGGLTLFMLNEDALRQRIRDA